MSSLLALLAIIRRLRRVQTPAQLRAIRPEDPPWVEGWRSRPSELRSDESVPGVVQVLAWP